MNPAEKLEAAASIIFETSRLHPGAGSDSRGTCPHGNSPTYPTHAWWCDECWDALGDALAACRKAGEAQQDIGIPWLIFNLRSIQAEASLPENVPDDGGYPARMRRIVRWAGGLADSLEPFREESGGCPGVFHCPSCSGRKGGGK